MRTPSGRWLAAALAIATLAGSGHAAQVFVDVQNYRFNPPSPGTAPTLGDFVIWTWSANGHTVTSGTTGSIAGDGSFNSDPLGATHGVGTVFAWKTDRSGAISYYCRAHFFTMNMKSTIVVPGPLPAV